MEFTASNAGNGNLTVQLGGLSLSSIAFATRTLDGREDFSLLALDTADAVNDVPEPATMMLLAGALLLAAPRLRRRQ